MNLYGEIKQKSTVIDWTETDLLEKRSIVFPVPQNHPRYSTIKQYCLMVIQLSNYHFLENDLILCDSAISNLLTEQIRNLPAIIFLDPTEDKLKTKKEADIFVHQHSGKAYDRVIVIGGGVLANFGGYVAESLKTNLVYVPTTVIAMSDACIGGKVRLNDIQDGVYTKHSYKSFYEPSEIVLDPRFLSNLTDEQVRIGLAEIIKHAIYQSPLLAEYILSDIFQPFTDKQSLLRVILWTADLKRICLEIDPEESKDGSYLILRAAHDISDGLEEKSRFSLPHGAAVEKAMIEDLYSQKEKYNLLLEIYTKLGIGCTNFSDQ